MEKFVRNHPLLGSSQDVNSVALTVKGILLTLIPLIVMLTAGLNITLNPDDLIAFVNTLFGIFTLGITLYGLGRKIWKALKVWTW